MAIGDGLNNAGKEAEGLYNQLRGVTSELKGQATIISKSRQAFRDFEKAAQDLLLAQKGERIMQPNFGTSIYDLLFENNTENIRKIDDIISKL